LTLALVLAAAALSVERACYVWIARAPRRFRQWCRHPRVARLGEPVVIVRRLFYGFKVVQLSVFLAWCWWAAADAWAPADLDGVALAIGGLLILAGQTLNVLVFYRLGAVGVFYGDRLGHQVQWCREFPFSMLSHPQYVGTVLSIWGFFLALRFPHDDWILLPALETVYYVVGARLEDRATPSARAQAGGAATTSSYACRLVINPECENTSSVTS
jgi:methylene-fatty-acyl-phospholipid synthase